MSIQTIKKEIEKLDKAKQADLMHFLIELLIEDDFQLSEEWKYELSERETALKNGTSVGRPAKEVSAKFISN